MVDPKDVQPHRRTIVPVIADSGELDGAAGRQVSWIEQEDDRASLQGRPKGNGNAILVFQGKGRRSVTEA